MLERELAFIARQMKDAGADSGSETDYRLDVVAGVVKNAGSDPTGLTGVRRIFEELDDVTLPAPVHVASLERELPAGSHGTVVGVWQGGRAYEVEFSEPFECLVTVPAEGLRS
jgi:hypothetical protein